MRSLERVEADPPGISRVTVGNIAVACMLTYFDQRKAVDWRAGCPSLDRWLRDFAESKPPLAAG